MTITLDPQLEATIQERIAKGPYDGPNDLIRDALRALDAEERLDRLRARLRVGLDQIERGEGRPLTPELFAEIKQNARRKVAEGHIPNPDVCP